MGKVVVLGASGMLGHQVYQQLSRAGMSVIPAVRSGSIAQPFSTPQIEVCAEVFTGEELTGFGEGDFIVNCIGLIKSAIRGPEDTAKAIATNALFPHQLSLAAENQGFRVIQIATDCVFSGKKGAYVESSHHDPTDVYGQTKSLGEVSSPQFMHLRCSIVGPELTRASSLFEWVRTQPRGARVPAYGNHLWNGVTSDSFSRIVGGIIEHAGFDPGIFHLCPDDLVTKAELVELIAQRAGRDDLIFQRTFGPELIDRTLKTENSSKNQLLWKQAGYDAVPSVADLVGGCPTS